MAQRWWRTLGWMFLVGLAWPAGGLAASVPLAWDYPTSPAIQVFRLYRQPGPCPVSAWLPPRALTVTVDSQETAAEPGAGSNVLDGDPATHWHTGYSTTVAPLPHWLVVDLGSAHQVEGFRYLPRQVGVNGRVKDWHLYTSMDNVNWGQAVAQGTFPAGTAEQVVLLLRPSVGRYVKLVALSELQGGPWSAVAEWRLLGTPAPTPAASTQVGEVPGTARTFTDTTVPATGTFCWQVVAVAQDGRVSAPSNATQVPPPPVAAPMDLRWVP